ncbi:DUF2637 domain-containing protein [Streptomyces sp. NPDC051567]|uniref:DUF2637 domain-containing protein n=1 Tax=Streptomyces sp. NPDC051567 TaxID=3365660 RepID=UPI0037A4D038
MTMTIEPGPALAAGTTATDPGVPGTPWSVTTPAAGVPAPGTPAGVPVRRSGAPAGREGVPAGHTVAAPGSAPAPAPAPVAGRVTRLLAVAALLGMIPVTVIGFAASYTTVAAKAEAAGFAAWLAPWIPIGLDGAILGFLALDLYMTRRRTPWPLLRFAAHGMTAATVLINAAAGATGAAEAGALPGPVRMFWHGLMPLLFIVGVEAVRRLIVHACRLEDGTAIDRIPLHRWVLSPWRTPRLYREMRLAVIRSYPEMVERRRALEGYRVWLKQELGGDLAEATDEQMLPMTMAGQGYTVEEALALPAKWRAAAEERQRAEADQVHAEAERGRVEAERQRQQVKADRLRALADDADIEVAVHEQAARKASAAATAEAVTAGARSEAGAAKAAAEHRRVAAERQSQVETQALESAQTAAARRKAAEDNASAEKAEAEAERQRAEAVKSKAERQRAEAESLRQAEVKERTEARKAEAEREKAVAAKEAAEARYETTLIEARAQQADDFARLSPRERSERQVARMILAAGGDPEAVLLSTIMEVLGLKQTAAGDIRKGAVVLLDGGYQPTGLETMMDAES